jgi:hypothetical protein
VIGFSCCGSPSHDFAKSHLILATLFKSIHTLIIIIIIIIFLIISKSDTRPSVVGRKILAQVQAAAKRVSTQLKEKYPNSKVSK